jgi:pimeloyl-ACP methyl ester carboxylesterase
MPGYGYSGKPRATGWGPDRIARAWTELMRRLGYRRFVAQGGDWGAIITDVLAVQAPPELLGMHTNMAGVVPADVSAALAQNVLGAGGPPPAGLSAEESATYEQLNFFYTKGIGYGIEMITQPQTLYGIADSPVGLAAWALNHDASSYSDIADAFAGHPVGNLTRDEVLDNLRNRCCSAPSCARRSGHCAPRARRCPDRGARRPPPSDQQRLSLRILGGIPSGSTPGCSGPPGRGPHRVERQALTC